MVERDYGLHVLFKGERELLDLMYCFKWKRVIAFHVLFKGEMAVMFGVGE